MNRKLLSTIVAVLFLVSLLPAPVVAACQPSITFTKISKYGNRDGVVRGRVPCGNRTTHKILTYIEILDDPAPGGPGNGFWVKPYAAKPLKGIKADRTFSVDITTGGPHTVDHLARRVYVFLVKLPYNPPIILGDDNFQPASLCGNPNVRGGWLIERPDVGKPVVSLLCPLK